MLFNTPFISPGLAVLLPKIVVSMSLLVYHKSFASVERTTDLNNKGITCLLTFGFRAAYDLSNLPVSISVQLSFNTYQPSAAQDPQQTWLRNVS